LGVDEAPVEVAPLVDRPQDACGVISWKTMRLTGSAGPALVEVPRDGLPLAVFVVAR